MGKQGVFYSIADLGGKRGRVGRRVKLRCQMMAVN